MIRCGDEAAFTRARGCGVHKQTKTHNKNGTYKSQKYERKGVPVQWGERRKTVLDGTPKGGDKSRKQKEPDGARKGRTVSGRGKGGASRQHSERVRVGQGGVRETQAHRRETRDLLTGNQVARTQTDMRPTTLRQARRGLSRFRGTHADVNGLVGKVVCGMSKRGARALVTGSQAYCSRHNTPHAKRSRPGDARRE